MLTQVIIRHMAAIPVAATVVTILFYLMHALIASPTGVSAFQEVPAIRFEPVEIEQTPVPERPKPPERPKDPVEPPKTPVNPMQQTELARTPIAQRLDLPTDFGGAGIGISVDSGWGNGADSSGLVPEVMLAPMYPQRERLNGVEGAVTVAFTVTEFGTVTDIEIVAANPPRVFDRAVRAAVSRWRFKPPVEAGRTVQTRAQQVIEFKIPN